MAQPNYTPIQLYRTATASAAPLAGNLTDGELAINTADGKLFYKDSGGTVRTIADVNATAGYFFGTSAAGASIRLYEDTDNGTNYVALKAADSIASNVTWTLPATDGTSGQVLSTNGSGTLSWATTASPSAAGGNTQIQYNNSGAFGASSSFTWDNANTVMAVQGFIRVGVVSPGSGYTLTSSASQTVFISPTGNNSTGTGTYANPWATISHAVAQLARFVPKGGNNIQLTLKNGTYTLSTTEYVNGFQGGGNLTITAETAGSVTINMNGYRIQFERINAEVRISGITFNQPSSPGMFQLFNANFVRFESNCKINNLTTSGSPGNFNEFLGVYNSSYCYLQCNVDITNTSSYGACVNVGNNSYFYHTGTFNKIGAKHPNQAICISDSSFGVFQGTINNFTTGVHMGRSHYDAELAGYGLANSMSTTNCTYGVYLSNNGTFKNYSTASTSGTTYPQWYEDGWFSGTYATSGYHLIGYNTSVSSSYRLQVNSQIYATSSTIATSDGRYKTNVADISGALDLVRALRPVQFDWIPHHIHNFDTENTTVGFIAQDLLRVMADKPYLNSIVKRNTIPLEAEEHEVRVIEPAQPEVRDERGNLVSLAKPAVYEKTVTKPAVVEEFFGIAEGNLIAILTKAIQEQQAIIDDLKARVVALEAK